MRELLTVTVVAKMLGVSSESVRSYETRGVLKAAFKTAGGMRLFRESDVKELAEKRRQSASSREDRRAG
jgi:DNA-binding transcriptional MerR regulator